MWPERAIATWVEMGGPAPSLSFPMEGGGAGRVDGNFQRCPQLSTSAARMRRPLLRDSSGGAADVSACAMTLWAGEGFPYSEENFPFPGTFLSIRSENFPPWGG
jgi:hypothetical protein